LAYAATRIWRRAKCIINLQDIYPKTLIDVGLLRPGFVARRLERMERATYRRADAVVVDSGVNNEHVQSRGAGRVEIIESWASTSQAPKPPTGVGHFRTHGTLLVCYAGMFSPHQGLNVVVDAAKLLASDSRLRFVLAGGGMERDKLCEQAKGMPNLQIAPYMEESAYLSLLQETDIGLVTLAPQVETAVPGKVYALMDAGVPIVASVPKNGPVPDVLARSGAGISVVAGDAQALADAIRALADDPQRRARLAEAGRIYATTKATKANAVRRYAQLIDELCARSSS
jgi:glycosyltransferase involved in cell wall biosynthesis